MLNSGDKLQIQCYKHNKELHRYWDEAVFIEENDEYVVFGNNKTLVIESNGNSWRTKEPAIMYFFKNRWFNVIVQFKDTGITYYCNIATPYIIEDNTIKYIDYDLDLRIYNDGSFKILDMMEFKYHQRIMKYSKDLNKTINVSLNELIQNYKKNHIVFNKCENTKHLNIFQTLINKSKK